MSIECGWQRARRVGSKFVESMKEGEMIIKDPHVSRWHRRLRQEHSQTQSSFQLKVFWRNYRIVPPFPFPVVLLPRARNKKEHEMRSRSKGKNTDHLSISIINIFQIEEGNPPSRMIRSNSRASSNTSMRLSRVAVIPVGLHPYCMADDRHTTMEQKAWSLQVQYTRP